MAYDSLKQAQEQCASSVQLRQTVADIETNAEALVGQRRSIEFIVHNEEFWEHDPEPLDEDIYGMGITSLLRDTRRLAMGSEGRLCLRISRLLATALLLLLNVALQLFLLYTFKRLVTAGSVHSIREAYDDYQGAMYDSPLDTTVNGYRRGRPENFHPEHFQGLPESQKRLICGCPLSQPLYLGAVLAIWTLTVLADVRKILFLMDLMFLRTPSIESYRDMLERDDENKTMTLKGLPRTIKCVLFVLMFLPRLIMDIALIWIGCRWLVATPSFGDLLLNAIALEFLLFLKDLFYTAVIPHRDKLETKQMLIPSNKEDVPTFLNTLGSFLWIFVVLCWVYVYIGYMQQVLPDYGWDIHTVCHPYIAAETTV